MVVSLPSTPRMGKGEDSCKQGFDNGLHAAAIRGSALPPSLLKKAAALLDAEWGSGGIKGKNGRDLKASQVADLPCSLLLLLQNGSKDKNLEVVGVCRLEPAALNVSTAIAGTEGKVCCLVAVTIAKRHRRHGLGRMLVKAAISHSKEALGMTHVCLSTHLPGYVDFYKDCGFSKEPNLCETLWGEVADSVEITWMYHCNLAHGTLAAYQL